MKTQFTLLSLSLLAACGKQNHPNVVTAPPVGESAHHNSRRTCDRSSAHRVSSVSSADAVVVVAYAETRLFIARSNMTPRATSQSTA